MFWRLTLREISVILDGCIAREKHEHDRTAWLAWHTARLTAYAPQKSKDFPRLRDLMHGGQPSRKMTPEQLEAVTRSWLEGARRNRG